MFYLQTNALLHTIKVIVVPSFPRQKSKLLSKCCVFKVRQYICIDGAIMGGSTPTTAFDGAI